MADKGHELTEELLLGIEERVKEEYQKALADADRRITSQIKLTSGAV